MIKRGEEVVGQVYLDYTSRSGKHFRLESSPIDDPDWEFRNHVLACPGGWFVICDANGDVHADEKDLEPEVAEYLRQRQKEKARS